MAEIFINDRLKVGDIREWKLASINDKIFDTEKEAEEYFYISPNSYHFSIDADSITATIARKVLPEELDIHLPGLKSLGLNYCQGQGVHNFDGWFAVLGSGVLAHSHICSRDPDRGMVCTNEKWLKNKDGTYSDLLLHELAHILTKYPAEVVTCGKGYNSHLYRYWGKDAEKSWTHGREWQEWAVKLGIPPIPYLSEEVYRELILS